MIEYINALFELSYWEIGPRSGRNDGSSSFPKTDSNSHCKWLLGMHFF